MIVVVGLTPFGAKLYFGNLQPKLSAKHTLTVHLTRDYRRGFRHINASCQVAGMCCIISPKFSAIDSVIDEVNVLIIVNRIQLVIFLAAPAL